MGTKVSNTIEEYRWEG